MKKTIILSLVVILLFSITTGYVLSKVSNMNITINAKDLPEEGLIIIKPSDPEFDKLSLNFLKTHSINKFDEIKPLSIFIKNTSSKTVVAHAIVWECIDSTGEKKPHTIRYIESPAITDGILGPRTNELSNQTLYPESYQLLSLLPIAETNGGGGSGGSYKKGSDKLTSQEISEENYLDRNELLRNKILAKCSEVTVSIDGVFFDDGSFVGPDSTSFFNMVKAHVEAKRNLTSYISANSGEGISGKEQKWQEVIEMAQNKSNAPPEGASSEEYYKYYSSIFAQQFLRVRQVQGEDKLLADLQYFSRKTLPEIRKLSHP